MSMLNSANLQVQIFRKNNSVIRWEVSAWEKNMEPLGMAAKFDTETICSGESLLLNMFLSYYPYSEPKYWLRESDEYFRVSGSDHNFPSKEIAKLIDLSSVKEIQIKEKFDWEGAGTRIETFTIKSDNCPYITNDKQYKPEDIDDKLKNRPKKTAASESVGNALIFIGKSFVTTGLDDWQEQRIKDIVQSHGGFFKTAVSKNTDYLITAPNIPQDDVTMKYQTAQEQISKGINIQIIPYRKFMDLADQHTQDSAETSEFLIKNGKLVRYLGKEDEVTLPDEVTEIGSKAFAGCNSVLSIKLNRNIKKINGHAFKDCNFLRKISVDGDKWENIEIQSFEQYVYMPQLVFVNMPEFYARKGTLLRYFGKEAIINIPHDVTIIGDLAFKGNEVAEEVYLSNNVTTISNEAFAQCKNLKKITLPDSVTSIGNNAFAECKKLEVIALPKKLSVLGATAFGWCRSLQSIQFPDTIKDIPNSVCYGCTSIREITLSKKTKQIGEYAFANCQSITEISLPKTVRKLSNWAFKDCTCLVSITIPPAVKKLGAALFESCSALQRVELSPQLTHIEGRAFFECTSLSRIVVYEGLKSIGNYAFSNCINLTEDSFVILPQQEVE